MFSGFYKNKRVLVTGHTGFKGSWLCEWLLSLGAEVAGYALDPQPHEVLFDQLKLGSRISKDHRGNISDLTKLQQIVSDFKPEVIFHLAAQPLVRLSYEQPVETFATNVIGTVNLLEAVRLSNYPCTVVCVTTDKCYENREWLHAYREEDAMGGHDPYSASKGAAELVIASYRRSFFSSPFSDLRHPTSETPLVHLASARAGNVIGGGDWAIDRIVPDCIRAIRAGQAIPVRNKIATRPWQHVLEPLSGYLHLAASLASSSSNQKSTPTTSGQAIINLSVVVSAKSDHQSSIESSSQDSATSLLSRTSRVSRLTSELSSAFNFGPNITSNRTVAELVQELIKHAGGKWLDASDPNAVHEASKLNLAIDKAYHLLGWQPVWSFEETIAQTAEWYLKEQQSTNLADLTRSQIESYHQAASAKGLPWAEE